MRESNLDNDLKEGLKGPKQKVKLGEGIVMPTDKTDGLSFETVKSYKLAAEEHVKNDKTWQNSFLGPGGMKVG